MDKISVKQMQAPLRAEYKASPLAAMVTDYSRAKGTNPNDPFHSMVEPMVGCGVEVPVGVHRAVGGPHDAPTPGDLLCAALAACQDSTVRMVANLMGIELEFLEVDVKSDADVRGALAMDMQVPVGFQAIRCDVRLRAKETTNPEDLERLRVTAERCCIVLQTLRNPPPIMTTFHM